MSIHHLDPDLHANQINRATGFEIPVDVEKVAQINNIKMIVHYEDLEDEISGMTVIQLDGTASVCINKNHHPNRRNFTLAHELGHILRHKDKTEFFDGLMLYFRDKDASIGIDEREIDANRFAAALLMPRCKLIKEAKKHYITLVGDNDLALRRLAAKFGVSVQALTIRMTKLGLIEDFSF
jgi:Zn-dependent peptidase ImmA (M78 family)